MLCVSAEDAEPEPTLFQAVTRTAIQYPMSSGAAVYSDPVAPSMSLQVDDPF